jgi:hypothetical protein
MGTKMKRILLAALVSTIGSSAAQAEESATSPRTEGPRFAAVSLTNGLNVRAIISNVIATANGAHLTPCQVQVSFVDADGSLIDNVTTVQLKPGESASVSASRPSKLVRAIVSIGDVPDPAKFCELRTSLEVFDLQTGTTYVSVPGEFYRGPNECTASVAPSLGAARKSVSGRENSAPIATSSLSGRKVSPKTAPPAVAATPRTTPK